MQNTSKAPVPQLDENSRIRRRFVNFYIRPSIQLWMMLHSTGLTVFSMGVLLGLVVFFLGAENVDGLISQVNVKYAWLLLQWTSVVMIVLGLASLFMTLVVSHRVVGPIQAINNHIDRLIEGDYSKNVQLRARDEFHDLAERLNTLTEKLRSEQGTKAKAKAP